MRFVLVPMVNQCNRIRFSFPVFLLRKNRVDNLCKLLAEIKSSLSTQTIVKSKHFYPNLVRMKPYCPIAVETRTRPRLSNQIRTAVCILRLHQSLPRPKRRTEKFSRCRQVQGTGAYPDINFFVFWRGCLFLSLGY